MQPQEILEEKNKESGKNLNLVIYKYSISNMISLFSNSKFTLTLPEHCRILCIQVDNKTNQPCLWVECNIKAPLIDVNFELNLTGKPYELNGARFYIGTFQLNGGMFVGHLFKIV